MRSFQTDEVFGVVRGVPLNYVERHDVDDHFVNTIQKNRHIVLHGSSKQGKTVLRKRWLPSGQTIVVQCMSSWSLSTLHGAILKEAGFEVVQKTTVEAGEKGKVAVRFGGRVKLPLFGEFDASANSGAGASSKKSSESRPLDLDLDDPNDVIRALASIEFSELITLEDFHYLPEDTQRDFAAALKAYHERSNLCFLIVGVWLERDRLTVYNGDLAGRLVSIDVDKWPSADLELVISKGEELLNVDFEMEFKRELIASSYESVYLVQDVCNAACIDAGIYQTMASRKSVTPAKNATEYVNEAVNKESARYRSFLSSFADGFKDTQLQMYRWILLAIINAAEADLEKGLRYRDIRNTIQRYHPEGAALNPANIAFALKAVASLQSKHAIKPLIIDYDFNADRLHVVDRGFLIWLRHQNRSELRHELNLPEPAPEGAPTQ